MKISEQVYQIRIDFQVTPQVQRYVYVYLLMGEKCCLIDAGVAGSEAVISTYMKKLGRDISDIKALFLTHAHPDHIGAAAAIKEISGCEVYASEKEIRWIEDIDTQYKERPIPNFYTLVGDSVKVDHCIREGQNVKIQQGMTLKVMETPGHSDGSLFWLWDEQKILFCGDAIPALDDVPIFTDLVKSQESIKRIMNRADIRTLCPAWDRKYEEWEWKEICQTQLELLERLRQCEAQIRNRQEKLSQEEMIHCIIKQMGWETEEANPLLRRSIQSCLI